MVREVRKTAYHKLYDNSRQTIRKNKPESKYPGAIVLSTPYQGAKRYLREAVDGLLNGFSFYNVLSNSHERGGD
jgi:hypothetical protein